MILMFDIVPLIQRFAVCCRKFIGNMLYITEVLKYFFFYIRSISYIL